MAIKYTIKKRNVRLSGEQRTLYSAVPKETNVMKYEELVREIVDRSSLSDGDVDSCMKELYKTIHRAVTAGRAVEILHIGTLHPRRSGKAKSTQAELTARELDKSHILFRPKKRLLEAVGRQEVEIEPYRPQPTLRADPGKAEP